MHAFYVPVHCGLAEIVSLYFYGALISHHMQSKFVSVRPPVCLFVLFVWVNVWVDLTILFVGGTGSTVSMFAVMHVKHKEIVFEDKMLLKLHHSSQTLTILSGGLK